MKKPIPLPLLLVLDTALIGAFVLCFALFHHVLPSYVLTIPTDVIEVPTLVTAPVAEADNASAETETGAPMEEKEPELRDVLRERFAEHFTEDIVVTDHSWSGPNLSITVTEYTGTIHGKAQHWYVEEIYTTDVTCIQSWTPGGFYNTKVSTMSRMVTESGALAAVNGDYAAIGEGGSIIRNGVLRRERESNLETLALYQDGSVICWPVGGFDARQALEDGAWQAWTFGPSLLDEQGRARTDFTGLYSSLTKANPRTVFGYYEPGHYCFVVADGRRSSATGFTMEELAALMESMGCTAAYNLDGGASSQMTFLGAFVNSPSQGEKRLLNDIIIVVDPSEVKP